ncbi:hypothetical protein [Xenorhabdus cabanillasii]|uniref:hypothetical protein n=1 Tax=Xenorhabdus cabanillasii TaxID=351673 RepID=UPI0004B3E26D|nr:hypothetical protein [Xenorhabdus cabanillasii]PHM76049.1 hypothetical protein Xcab_03431 [Xenorhabdus cabanillasii JM26]
MKYTSVRIQAFDGGCRVYAEWPSDGWNNLRLLCTAYDVDGGVVVCDKQTMRPVRVLPSMNDFRRYIENETGLKLPLPNK